MTFPGRRLTVKAESLRRSSKPFSGADEWKANPLGFRRQPPRGKWRSFLAGGPGFRWGGGPFRHVDSGPAADGSPQTFELVLEIPARHSCSTLAADRVTPGPIAVPGKRTIVFSTSWTWAPPR